GPVVQPQNDPFSGQPEMKATPVRISPVAATARGVAVSHDQPTAPESAWWARLALVGGEALILTATGDPAALTAEAARLFPKPEPAETADPARGLYRVAAFENGRLVGLLVLGSPDRAPQWDGLAELLLTESLDADQRRAAVTGARAGARSGGRIVCACFGVGIETIREAIRDGAANAPAIGPVLQAATNSPSSI